MFYSDDISSDDEIVWTGTDGDLSLSTESSIYPTSEDDFVVLRPQRSRGSSVGLSTPSVADNSTYHAEEALSSTFSRLALNDFPTSRSSCRTPTRSFPTGRRPDGQRKPPSYTQTSRASGVMTNQSSRAPGTMTSRKRPPNFVHASPSRAYPSPAASPNYSWPSSTVRPTYVPKDKSRKDRKQKEKKHPTRPRAAASPGAGLGFRPVVDDISERASDNGEDATTAVHQEAVRYITSFLTNPEAEVCRLTLLQSLIIELGLITSCTPIIPNSLTAAKALLKSRAFLNIREYLAVRDQGQEALQQVMHPNRTALIKDIRTKGNPASLKWVKENGLQVFLVTCFQ